MGEKIRRKALLILSCVLMLEAVGSRHVPNFQRVGLILYAAGMLAMYAMTLRRKIKGLAVNENDFMPFLFGAGLLAIEVRRYDFGEEGKLWLWIIIIRCCWRCRCCLRSAAFRPERRGTTNTGCAPSRLCS